jgi:phosphate transport system protein
MISEQTAKLFDGDPRALTRLVSEMANLTEGQARNAIEALAQGHLAIAQEVITGDNVIDAIEREIESRTVVTLVQRHPMAVDLRRVVGLLRIANDLERIGDLAKNIAKRVIALDGKLPLVRPIRNMTAMTTLLLSQLRLAFDSLSETGRFDAMAVRRSDKELDALHASVVSDLLDWMFDDPSAGIPVGTHLLFCAKNIERMGDHAVRIADAIHYIAEGRGLSDSDGVGDIVTTGQHMTRPTPAV